MTDKIVFFRTAWMKFYKGLTSDDKPLNGGTFIEENGWGGEIYNFKPLNGKIYGYVRAGNNEDATIDISRLGAASQDEYIDDVLVIWLATRPGGQTEIIGWYKNARVFRRPQHPDDTIDRWIKIKRTRENINYRIVAEESNCALLEENNRGYAIRSQGQSNIRYKENFDDGTISNILDYLNRHNNPNNSELRPKSWAEHAEDLMTSKIKNIILYGPPGTGKTYSTKEFAVRLAKGEDPRRIYKTLNNAEQYLEEYKRLRNERQIEVITFHQNYAYEDFIQGIRPDTDQENRLVFQLKDGIFKTLCDIARSRKEVSYSFNESQINFYKMSLGEANRKEDDEIYNYCMAENVVALGWGGKDIDYSGAKNKEEIAAIFNKRHPNDLKSNVVFMNKFMQMKKGDVVLISKGNSSIRAIGKIEGDYELDEDAEIPYKHFRKVTWLYKDALIPIQTLSRKILSQQTIYALNKANLKMDELKKYLSTEKQEEKNYVIIIDEINRANISRVFGELITLIEEDKRGEEIILPSGKPFSVPNNLFILGTMNTADKSIALIDIALRRRFTFYGFYPKYNLVRNKKSREILENLNKQIRESEKGPDFQIGHSYFMDIDEKDIAHVMNDKIIPLLYEYFMNDRDSVKSLLESARVGYRVDDNGILQYND